MRVDGGAVVTELEVVKWRERDFLSESLAAKSTCLSKLGWGPGFVAAGKYSPAHPCQALAA